MSDTSPLMSQYRDIKRQYPDSVLLFRVGDFYETFYEDAIDVASILNITLTSRDKNKAVPVPLAGVPFHAAEGYIGRLLAAGRKVAICEQTEDPALAKGLVKRDVVEVLTPGTALNAQLVADPDNNYCAAVHANGDGRVAVALIDVGTGECVSGEAPADSFLHLIQGKRVRELVVSKQIEPRLRALLLEHLDQPFITEIDETEFASAAADDVFKNQFGDNADSAAGSLAATERVVAAALISHCMSLRGSRLAQLVRIERAADVPFMHLDEETIGNLELFDPLRGGRNDATVLRILDKTRTPMGNRELRHWMQKPLCDVTAIDERLDAVARVYSDATLAETLVRELGGMADIQRIAARIAARKAIPRELHALRESLAHVPALENATRGAAVPLFSAAADALGNHEDTCAMIERAIVPPRLRS
jgi:DNA mismatch repair protein MutS